MPHECAKALFAPICGTVTADHAASRIKIDRTPDLVNVILGFLCLAEEELILPSSEKISCLLFKIGGIHSQVLQAVG